MIDRIIDCRLHRKKLAESHQVFKVGQEVPTSYLDLYFFFFERFLGKFGIAVEKEATLVAFLGDFLLKGELFDYNLV